MEKTKEPEQALPKLTEQDILIREAMAQKASGPDRKLQHRGQLAKATGKRRAKNKQGRKSRQRNNR